MLVFRNTLVRAKKRKFMVKSIMFKDLSQTCLRLAAIIPYHILQKILQINAKYNGLQEELPSTEEGPSTPFLHQVLGN